VKQILFRTFIYCI